MTLWPIFGLLAGGALWASWRSFEVRPVGIALAAGWIGSNLAHWYLSPVEQPAAYTVCEVMILSMAFLAHVCGASKAMVAVVVVSMISITSNIALSAMPAPTIPQLNLWVLITNLCFVGECLAIIGAGVKQRVRIHSRSIDGCDNASFHGSAAYTTKAER